MPQEIRDHFVDGASTNIAVQELEANVYQVTLPAPAAPLVLDFRAGLTNEALIAIVRHRLVGQNRALPDPNTGGALYELFRGLGLLQRRTRDRIAKGVEGNKGNNDG